MSLVRGQVGSGKICFQLLRERNFVSHRTLPPSMKNILASGLAAALVAGGLGLTAGPAQASPTSTTTTRAAAQGPLPLDLCSVLVDLCQSQGLGELLTGVDNALDDLLGTSPTGTPQQIQETVQSVVQAIVATLTEINDPADLQAAVQAIASRLTTSGLDPAVLTQVLAGLGTNGELPTSALSGLVGTLVDTVQSIVSGLLGIGGQTPDPAQVQALVDQILDALAAGDPAALQALVRDLLTSLPGASGLSPATLTDLVGQVIDGLQGTLGAGSSTTIVNNVNEAINGPAAAATPVVSSPRGNTTSRRPVIRGTGTPGAMVSVRTSTGTVLGSATVRSTGAFSVTSRKLKIAAYRVSAIQMQSGRAVSAPSATRTFRVVSAKPVITTKSKKKFSTKRPKITGIGYPKSRIVLRSSTGKKLGSTKVRTNGTWTITSKRLSSGTRKIKAVQTGHGKKKTTKVRTIRIR
jgi:hypothetical protein